MTKARVTFRGEWASVMLSKDVLEEAGIRDGDELDIAIMENAILLLTDATRAELIRQATDKVFDKYAGVLAELAEGESGASREKRVEKIAQDLIERRAEVYRSLASRDK